MEQIILNIEDFQLLKTKYSDLAYSKLNNMISGSLNFLREYNNEKVGGKYHIEFKLENSQGSILPKVRETKGKILNIAKRKNISTADVHLNSEDGVLCLIFPIKEKYYYPNGFEFKRFMNHLEEHLYWVTYFDRYNKKPWKDEPHHTEAALINAVSENKNYRKDLRTYIEKKEKRKYSRPEFRRYLKKNKLL